MSDADRSLKTLKVSDIFLPKVEQSAMNELTITGGDLLDISDGYHTMSELYEHRMALNAALFNILLQTFRVFGNVEVMKSRLHNDGTMFEGYFIVLACFPDGKNQISYHYEMKYWNLFKIPEVPYVPFEYDGHTSKDVIERLLKL